MSERGDKMIPTEKQITAVRRFGYSPKEAQFVASAALHSGYFVQRQVRAKYGRSSDEICRKTQEFGHATRHVYGHNTTVYHLTAKPLYYALGQPDIKHRREADSYHVRAKLMGFDYVLLHPEFRFLPTEDDKLNYFLFERKLPVEVLPTQVYESATNRGDNTRRWFIEKFPIAINRDTGLVSCCFIDTGVFSEIGFRTWLHKYLPLLNALPSSEIVYVGDALMSEADDARVEFEHQTSRELRTVSIELYDYFVARKAIEEAGRDALKGWPIERFGWYNEMTKKYDGEAFNRQYEVWKSPSSEQDTCPILFRFEALPFTYNWLGTAGKRTRT